MPRSQPYESRGAPTGLAIYAAKTVGIVESRIGTQIRPGTADLYYIDSTDTLTQYTDANGDSVRVFVYNMSREDIPDATWIQLKQELFTGRLLVDFEDCVPG